MPVVEGCFYPTNAELNELQRLMLPRFAEGRLGLQLAPTRETDRAEIIFNTPDIFRGMQQWRGLDKPTPSVPINYNHWGVWCKLTPGYWGEHEKVTEELLTIAASRHSLCAEPIDLFEVISELQGLLMERRYNRVEFNIWQGFIWGSYEALNHQGKVVQEATFNINKVAVSTPWADADNSTPLMDIRCMQLLQRGTSTSFGSCARVYMNQVTVNCLLRNRNTWDLGKHGVSACCDPFTLDRVNEILLANNLPTIEVYEGGFYDDAGGFHTYIPDGRFVIVGCRPGGVPIARYWLTRNAVDCVNATGVGSGFVQRLLDNCNIEIPRQIKLYDLHNGGLGIHYPHAVISVETGCTYENTCG